MSDSESRRVAVVTGAARGIGRACAILLARSGLAVALGVSGASTWRWRGHNGPVQEHDWDMGARQAER